MVFLCVCECCGVVGSGVVFFCCRSMAQTRTPVQRTKLSDLVDLTFEERKPVRFNCGFLCLFDTFMPVCSSWTPCLPKRIRPRRLIMKGRKQSSSRGLDQKCQPRHGTLLTSRKTKTIHASTILVACIAHAWLYILVINMLVGWTISSHIRWYLLQDRDVYISNSTAKVGNPAHAFVHMHSSLFLQWCKGL